MKAAQLCLFGFDGLTAPNWIKNLISRDELAGVILFRRNIQNKEQLKELINELKSCRSPSQAPLLVSVDHEGGRVFRLPEPFTKIPTAREIGKYSPSPQSSPIQGEENRQFPSPPVGEGQGEGLTPYSIGQLMAQELSQVGFNLNYAPVLDIDSNPINPIIGDRAFSSDPKIVWDCAAQLIEGLHHGKVLGCGKHFPGHGDTSKDSHYELPTVEASAQLLEERELFPFVQAIQNNIEMLMTAHVMYPAWDNEWPATLSEKIINQILRKNLNYKGVVISDDFNMKAIADRWGIAQAATRFLEVGGDIVLVCQHEEVCVPTLEAVQKWLDKDSANLDRAKQSLHRIKCHLLDKIK